MSPLAPKGWCPGALRPMQTGDGYLVRLRLSNGALSFARAAEIAALSERFGNGLIDLSARANMQFRGVSEDALAPLWARLAEIGLLDEDPEAEAVRNVVPSPLAGFDASAALDARPLVAALEARLTGEKALRALPSKFGFLIDGGGLLPLTGVDADVRFEAYATRAGARLRVRLGGVCVGAIAPEKLSAAGAAIAGNFLRLRVDERRMGALVARIGGPPLAHGADLEEGADLPLPQERIGPSKVVGAKALGGRAYVGAGLAFGRLLADDLRFLADRAQAHGAAELRLTPWRALLAPGLDRACAEALARELESRDFVLDGRDPRLALAACPGKPACASANADVRALALRLSPLLAGRDGVLHVSGCAKGCARHAASALTIVATTTGFDLVENGLARDEPLLRGLDLAGLEDFLTIHRQGAQV